MWLILYRLHPRFNVLIRQITNKDVPQGSNKAETCFAAYSSGRCCQPLVFMPANHLPFLSPPHTIPLTPDHQLNKDVPQGSDKAQPM
jgi:hypothetical protein